MELRFHWMLPKAGEVAIDETQTAQEAARYRVAAIGSDSPASRVDLKGWTHFARQSERSGIESVLVALSRCEPDPLMTVCALGRATSKLKFIAAYRSGLMQPTIFAQQVNTISALIDGRIALNIVAGSSTEEQRGYGDHLPHDERYERAEEFLAVCNAFWRMEGEVDFDGKYYRVERGRLHTPFLAPARRAPEIYVSGHSEKAERLALSQGACLLRAADRPDTLRSWVARLRQQGVEVCLRACVLCRESREEAFEAAKSLLPDRDESVIAAKDDSQMYREAGEVKGNHWLTRSLWTGLVPHYGPVWTALLGTADDIAQAILEYKSIGVTQFILSGWPEIDEVAIFGEKIIPLIREAERGKAAR
jgi:alkanesulfonate monooxygenase